MSMGEQKSFDLWVNGALLLNADQGSVLSESLNKISTGTGVNNMLGDSVTIKSITINFLFVWPADYDDIFDISGNLNNIVNNGTIWVRVALILDTQCNGTTPGWTDIYFGSGSNVTDKRQMNYKSRFKVLKEWLFPMTRPNDTIIQTSGNPTPNGVVIYPRVTRAIKYFKKCNIRLDFSNMTGGSRNMNEIRSNNLFLAGGSTFTATDSRVTMDADVRLRFLDN